MSLFAVLKRVICHPVHFHRSMICLIYPILKAVSQNGINSFYNAELLFPPLFRRVLSMAFIRSTYSQNTPRGTCTPRKFDQLNLVEAPLEKNGMVPLKKHGIQSKV